MRLAVVALVTALAGACTPAMPRPPYTAQPSSALVEVTRPPPPARVEIIPARPREDAVWLDGEWIWRRSRWAWLSGRWVVPPAGAAFSVWSFVRGVDGRLWYAPGEWRDTHQAVVDSPPALAMALVEGGAVVDADGRTETTGPILRERPRERDEEEGHDAQGHPAPAPP
jgi:hypothetical protein